MGLKRLYVHTSPCDTVLDGFREILSGYVVGHGLDPDVTMGPLNNRMQLEKVRAFVEDGRRRGARVEEFGYLKDAALDAGQFHMPMLVTDADLGTPIVTEEQFGPVLPIIPYRDEDEAIAFANDSRFGLCSSVWSEHLGTAMAVACRINAGYTYINHHGPLAQDNRAPFGGVKHGGIGRRLGIVGVREFQETHSITVFR
jgi:acyl-CoA reductase-like NAD-dependent aldehyde dehydrogenase